MAKGVNRVIGMRGDDSLNIRLPDGLRDRIKSAAYKNGHSMNTAIIMLLEEAFPASIEPESVNQALLTASQNVAIQWADLLRAIGQDPCQNAALKNLNSSIADAEKFDGGGSHG
ncbi:MAG: Arc family DNA-binding protein [Rhizobium sp.]|nr:Arc family DNA-binding protein [Rhizobium sp.]